MLFLVFYMFAILAMILFKENDPWHFATLHLSILSLFRASTFEDWTDIMYINMFGCDAYGYGDTPELCVRSHASGLASVVFFFVFEIIAALVMLTLFIGVVTTSMDQAENDMKDSLARDARLKKMLRLADPPIPDGEVFLYRRVFGALDLDESEIGRASCRERV